MSMTAASSRYFEENAGQWDSLRAGYFGESVRESAIAKAYLRAEMVVADVGAGTGFMAAGLAPLVRQVHVVDGSPAMLDVARKNLSAFNNLVFHKADGQNLPFPDGSLDAVFANMFLHHCPDPLAAIQEMARVLKPGGRLVITDMDAHEYEWLREEMADEWMGFERNQMRAWFREADLVNLVITGTGQSCNAESQDPALFTTGERQAKISIFVASGTRRVKGARQAVQENYGALAESGSSCCGSSPAESSNASLDNSSCCSGSGSSCCSMDSLQEVIPASDINFVTGYTPAEKMQAPPEAVEMSLGCGNPIALANLKPGEAVLDIGSGGGIDAFLAAQRVGPQGRVIGVDMTPSMLERARKSAEKAGLSQVEFRFGHAEALPVEDESVDVILSNCVINLCEDKGKVFEEAFRVLKAGGRLEVSDMVSDAPFPLQLQQDPENWGGCVFGALPEQEYVDLIAQAGFKDIAVRRSTSAGGIEGVQVYSVGVSAIKTS